MSGISYWTVEHIGADRAVVVDDGGRALTLPRSALPAGVEKLAVLRIAMPEDGEMDWSQATVDADETDKRRRHSEEISKRLRLSDPKGFIYMPDE